MAPEAVELGRMSAVPWTIKLFKFFLKEKENNTQRLRKKENDLKQHQPKVYNVQLLEFHEMHHVRILKDKY